MIRKCYPKEDCGRDEEGKPVLSSTAREEAESEGMVLLCEAVRGGTKDEHVRNYVRCRLFNNDKKEMRARTLKFRKHRRRKDPRKDPRKRTCKHMPGETRDQAEARIRHEYQEDQPWESFNEQEPPPSRECKEKGSKDAPRLSISRPVAAALAALPSQDAHIVRSWAIDEKSRQEIARETGMTEWQVRTAIERCKAVLRSALADYEPE